MGLTIFSGRIDLTEPAGNKSDYERFILTVNPDSSRTLRTVTRSPKGDLLRDVNQMVAADWRPIEAMGRLFFKNEPQGTVLRRVIGDKIHSYVWAPGAEMDYQVIDAPPRMTLGYHPIFHDAWKMNYLDLSHHEYQDILTHTVSNTWNGHTLGHGMKIKAQVKFDGRETLKVPAGSFDCERFIWQSTFGKELHVWRHGPHHVFVKMFVAKGDKTGSIYELATFEEKSVVWP